MAGAFVHACARFGRVCDFRRRRFRLGASRGRFSEDALLCKRRCDFFACTSDYCRHPYDVGCFSTVPVVVAFLVAFPVAYSTLVRQFEHNEQLFDVCKVYNVSAANKIKFYLLPLIRDELLSVAEEELPLCIKVVIAGEVLALPLNAVGREMYVSKIGVETARVVALTLIVFVVCFVISGVLGFVRRRVRDRA